MGFEGLGSGIQALGLNRLQQVRSSGCMALTMGPQALNKQRLYPSLCQGSGFRFRV